jgi:hypothetical protein
VKPISSPYLVTPLQTIAATRQAGLENDQLTLSGMAVLTFSRAILDRLTELCKLKDAAWIQPRHHPYVAAEIVKRGDYKGLGVIVLVPPAGPSPMSCILEDLITCGVQAIFLVCAAWSLGSPVGFGDLIVPSYSIGADGTSIHYGNMWVGTRPAKLCIASRHQWRQNIVNRAACAWKTVRPAQCSL